MWKVPNVVRAFSTVIVRDRQGIVWESCRVDGDFVNGCSVGLVPADFTVRFVNVHVKFFCVRDWR